MKLLVSTFLITILISSCSIWDNISEEELVGTKWISDFGSTISFFEDSVDVTNIYVYNKCPENFESATIYIDSLVNSFNYCVKPIDSISFKGTWRAKKSSPTKVGGIWIDTKRNEHGYGYSFQFSSVEYYSLSLKKDNKYGIFLNRNRELIFFINEPDDWKNCLIWNEK